MAEFTRDWDESTPLGTEDGNLADDYLRRNKVNIGDRLKALIYGYVAGENDGVPGCKHLAFKQQSSDATVATDTIALYAKNVGGNNELFTKDEAGTVVQLTSAGTVGAGGLTLLAGKDLIGSSTSDITIATNKFTVAGATGNTVIAGTLTQTGAVAAAGSITLGAGADLIGSETSDITINTDKFTVAGDTGNTVIAGTLTVSGAASMFGTPTENDTTPAALAEDTIYQSECDGFLTVSDENNDNGFDIYVDDTDGATTILATIENRASNKSSITVPVPLGFYVQVAQEHGSTSPTKITWTPVGAGGLVDQT